MIHRLYEPKVRAGFFGLWCLGWVAVTMALLAPLPFPMPGGSDLVAHVAVFAAMSFGAVAFCHGPFRLAGLALLTTLAGLLLEYAQSFTRYRIFDVQDAWADALGAGLGYALALVVLYSLIRPADPALREARAARV